MALKRGKWEDLIIGGLIALVFFIVLSEETLGWFMQKPFGGIITLMVVGILGYIYFTK